MRRIQILVTRPYKQWFSIVSWLICLAQWSNHSHAVLYLPETHRLRHVYFNDILEEDISSFMLKNRLVNMRTISLTDEQYQAVDEYSKSKLGKQTGYFSTFFGSLIPQIFRNIFKIYLKNPLYKGITSGDFIRESLRKIDNYTVCVLTSNIPEGIFNSKDALDLSDQL
jgi:hypothetical protein